MCSSDLDHSRAMVDRARRRFRRSGRVELHLATAGAIPLAAASVDKAASVNVVYFWSDPEAVLRELARVVRPGGRLVLGFEPPETMRAWAGHRYGFRLFESAELRDLMISAGFVQVEVSERSIPRRGRFCALTGERPQAQSAP